MSTRRSDFNPSTVYDWESEPQDERPSEFAQTTGYRVHSGFYAAPVVSSRGSSSWLTWLAFGTVAGLALAAMLLLVKTLRA